MLEGTYHLVLVLGHVAFVTALALGFVPEAEEIVTISALFGLLLFATAGIASSNVVTIASDGSRIVTSQPAIGTYAYGLALASGLLSVYATLSWLPGATEVSKNEPF